MNPQDFDTQLHRIIYLLTDGENIDSGFKKHTIINAKQAIKHLIAQRIGDNEPAEWVQERPGVRSQDARSAFRNDLKDQLRQAFNLEVKSP